MISVHYQTSRVNMRKHSAVFCGLPKSKTNPFSTIYSIMLLDSVNVDSGLTGFQLAMATLLAKAPEFVGDLLVGAAARGTNVFGKFMSISNEIAMSVITREKEAARLGKTQSRDLLSILGKPILTMSVRPNLTVSKFGQI